MDEAFLAELLAYIEEHKIVGVGLGYYGEITLIDGWWRVADRLAVRGIKLSCTTNAAVPWSPEEVAAFARFHEIEISIDTHDAEILKRVRKKLDVRTVVYNHQMLCAHCLSNGIVGPRIVWSGALTHHVAPTLAGFLSFAAANRVAFVQFNEVGIYDGAPEKGLSILEIESADAFIEAAARVEEAFAVAERLGITFSVAGIERIRARRKAIAEGTPFAAHLAMRSTPIASVMTHNEANQLPPGYTRACTLPWSSFYLDPKARCSPVARAGT